MEIMQGVRRRRAITISPVQMTRLKGFFQHVAQWRCLQENCRETHRVEVLQGVARVEGLAAVQAQLGGARLQRLVAAYVALQHVPWVAPVHALAVSSKLLLVSFSQRGGKLGNSLNSIMELFLV